MKRRRRAVETELPLLIDLLRLLQGVGFSMDQSLQTLGDKLRDALPVLGSELQEANVAYTHGRTRAVLRRLSEVYADDDLTSLMQLILQVHAHGGAVQEPLRQFSLRLREQRRNTLKEKVGKLSVKMTVVMMLTLLPALMLLAGRRWSRWPPPCPRWDRPDACPAHLLPAACPRCHHRWLWVDHAEVPARAWLRPNRHRRTAAMRTWS